MAETLTPIVAHLRAAAYTCAAAGTVLLYDILLTSKDEIRLIWPSEFSLVKCLYLVNRYLPVPCLIVGMYYLADLRAPLSTNVCKLVTLSQAVGRAIPLVAATWLLVIRVLALYSGNKTLAIALYFVFISTHVISMVFSIIIIHDVWGNIVYIEFLGICAANSPRFVVVAYVVPVVCETVLVVLQLFHAYQHTRRLNTLRPITPLLRTLYADGSAYFVVVVTLRLWSCFMFIATDSSYWYISTYLEFALISTSASRLVLHLRKAAEIHRQSHMHTRTSFPLSQLTQRPKSNANNNDNPHRNPKFHIRDGQQPPNRNHSHHRRPRRNHALSFFQSAAETTSMYPSQFPRFRFEHLPEAESIASMEHGVGAKGVDGSRSLLAIPEIGKRSGLGSHICDSSCDDFYGDGAVGAGSREGDGHSSVELSPANPISRTERWESKSPPDMGDLEGGGDGHGGDMRMNRTLDPRVSSRGIE